MKAKIMSLIKGALPTVVVVCLVLLAYNKNEKVRKLLGGA